MKRETKSLSNPFLNQPAFAFKLLKKERQRPIMFYISRDVCKTCKNGRCQAENVKVVECMEYKMGGFKK